MTSVCYAFTFPLPIGQKSSTLLKACPTVPDTGSQNRNRPQFFRPQYFPCLSSEASTPTEDPTPVVPAPSDSAANSDKSTYLIPGTPCFTSHILASPMPREAREVYLSAVTDAVDVFLSAWKRDASMSTLGPTVAQVTLRVPQLDPSLDIYDRRFLLQAAWAVLSATVAEHSLRTRVLVQGRREFGAIPLSVAGLRRTFEGDLALSAPDWPPDSIRSSDLEDEAAIADDDDLFLVLSPTNAVSIPIIDEIISVANRVGPRPVILLNPRLDDIPSHSGVMQVSGRAARIEFLDSIVDLLYFRVLYDPGASYPPRGILYRCWPGDWQIWRSENIDKNYILMSSRKSKPKPSEITDVFRADAYARRKNASVLEKKGNLESDLFKPQLVVAFIFVVGVVIVVLGGTGQILELLGQLK